MEQKNQSFNDMVLTHITADHIGYTVEKEGIVRYRIDYTGRKCSDYANSSKELVERIKTQKREDIADIRKVYKNGVADGVMEIYKRHIKDGQ